MAMRYDFEQATGEPPSVVYRQRRRAATRQFVFWMATLVASVFAMGVWVGTAHATRINPQPCQQVFPAPYTYTPKGFLVEARPVGIDWVRCMRRTGQLEWS